MSEYCEVCHNLYEIAPDGNTPKHVCLVCGFKTVLPPNTLLYTKTNYNAQVEHDPITLGPTDQKINSGITMKTTNYTCPNKDCPTHKNPELKSASFERFNYMSYKVYYICNVCKTRWY